MGFSQKLAYVWITRSRLVSEGLETPSTAGQETGGTISGCLRDADSLSLLLLLLGRGGIVAFAHLHLHSVAALHGETAEAAV